jgi:CTP synthase (UTP-ammonia lyase)
MPQIAIVGDYNPHNETHVATDAAIGHAAAALACDVRAEWLGTSQLAGREAATLAAYDGIWIGPGSPYRSMDAALAAIRFARENSRPLIGTCGGFQHIVLEYGRNVLGFQDAQHAETDPYASTLFITKLPCSLAGKRLEIRLTPGSLAANLYGQQCVDERFYCNFGLNPEYQRELVAAGLRVTGVDEAGAARIVEIATHSFFLGTLFVPQALSTAEQPHPLVVGFIRQADGNGTS